MSMDMPADDGVSQSARRALWPAIRRGLRGNCPSCGQGRIFSRFITVEDNCAKCGLELHHHRADDLPAYLVVLIIGHVVVAASMIVQAATSISMWWHLAIWLPLTATVAILALKPAKGAVIALQWALRMHGFADAEDMSGEEIYK